MLYTFTLLMYNKRIPTQIRTCHQTNFHTPKLTYYHSQHTLQVKRVLLLLLSFTTNSFGKTSSTIIINRFVLSQTRSNLSVISTVSVSVSFSFYKHHSYYSQKANECSKSSHTYNYTFIYHNLSLSHHSEITRRAVGPD